VDVSEVVPGLRPHRIVTLKDLPGENASWLLEDAGGCVVVLRRYHEGATPEDLAYEHAVLRHLAADGWLVPGPARPRPAARAAPGWQAQHEGITVHASLDWEACLRGLTGTPPP
jgi:Ser/Thr protein kinase RdoA (MazF antagonist)